MRQSKRLSNSHDKSSPAFGFPTKSIWQREPKNHPSRFALPLSIAFLCLSAWFGAFFLALLFVSAFHFCHSWRLNHSTWWIRAFFFSLAAFRCTLMCWRGNNIVNIRTSFLSLSWKLPIRFTARPRQLCDNNIIHVICGNDRRLPFHFVFGSRVAFAVLPFSRLLCDDTQIRESLRLINYPKSLIKSLMWCTAATQIETLRERLHKFSH